MPQADLAAFQDIRRHAYFSTNWHLGQPAAAQGMLVAIFNVVNCAGDPQRKTVMKDSRSPAVFQLRNGHGRGDRHGLQAHCCALDAIALCR